MQTASASPIKVIHADDHKLFRMGVRNSLSGRHGISIIGEAENGKELLRLLEHLQPDVIILNIQMPVMDGLATLPVLKARYPAIKVIILSMHNDPGIICRMVELGASGYLTKDAGSDEIYKAILACHEHWFYINDTVINAFSRKKKAIPEGQLPDGFSEKEVMVARLLHDGLTEKAIADEVDLSPRTVAAMIDRLHTKTGTETREALIEYAKKNFITDESQANNH